MTLVSSLPVPRLESNLSSTEIAHHLGLTPRIACIVLVEDYVAASLLKAILALEPNLEMTTTTRFLESGESGVRETIRQLKSLDDGVPSIVGVLDGDQRSRLGVGLNCLPGFGSPERVMREHIGAWRAGASRRVELSVLTR